MTRAAIACVAAMAVLHGCSIVNPPGMGALPPPERWLNAAGSLPVQADWWKAFGDPVLEHLVSDALSRNLDIREAAARIDEARALSDAQHGAQMPTLDFAASGQRSRSVHPAFGRPYIATVGQPLFVAAYEVDLWGRLDALSKAADANASAIAATRDAVALSVAASVAGAYFNLLSYDAQLDVARRTLESRQRSLDLLRSRESRGYGNALETAQAAAELYATAETIPRLESAAQRQELGINVLLGRNPGPVERGTPLLELKVPALPSAGLPSELLRRRPDIASAESQVAATDARLSAARAQLLPSVRFSAALGRVTSTALRGDPFTIWSLGGSVLAPIFNGGQLRALARASASRRDQALIEYERAVITAFSEVETQLVTFAKLEQQIAEAQSQRVAVAEALRIARNRYREGYSSYLDELLAQRNLFAVEQNLVQLRAQLVSAEVGLYRALGGGWNGVDAVAQSPR